MGEAELKSRVGRQRWLGLGGAGYNIDDPESCNAILGNMGDVRQVEIDFAVGHLNVPAALNAIFLHSDTLSSLTNLGPNPQSTTCLCKIMVGGANQSDYAINV